MNRLENYILQINQLHDGGSWQGEYFSEKIGSVDENTAFRAPVEGVHCIAEIIWHCIYWRTVLIKIFEGDQSYRDATIETQNFLPVSELRAKGWDFLKSEFQRTKHEIIDRLSQSKENILEAEAAAGKNFDYYIEGIVQHDIYHLGQIGLVKKILSVNGS